MPAGKKWGIWLFYKCGQGFELGTNENKSSKQSKWDMKFLCKLSPACLALSLSHHTLCVMNGSVGSEPLWTPYLPQKKEV